MNRWAVAVAAQPGHVDGVLAVRRRNRIGEHRANRPPGHPPRRQVENADLLATPLALDAEQLEVGRPARFGSLFPLLLDLTLRDHILGVLYRKTLCDTRRQRPRHTPSG
jgi:hypothetical protein